MGGTSIWHWLVVGVIVLLLFGRGKISEVMGDFAKGIKAFKKGMTDEDTVTPTTVTPVTPVTPTEPVRTLDHHPATVKTSEPVAGTGGAPFGERKLG